MNLTNTKFDKQETVLLHKGFCSLTKCHEEFSLILTKQKENNNSYQIMFKIKRHIHTPYTHKLFRSFVKTHFHMFYTYTLCYILYSNFYTHVQFFSIIIYPTLKQRQYIYPVVVPKLPDQLLICIIVLKKILFNVEMKRQQ